MKRFHKQEEDEKEELPITTKPKNQPSSSKLKKLIIGLIIIIVLYVTYVSYVAIKNIPDYLSTLLITELVRKGKLKTLLGEVVDRVYLYDHKKQPKLFLGIDTSHANEFSIIVKHMLNNPRYLTMETNAKRLVIDIGAHDCLSGSNSYNFIQMGFDAVLVEPFPPNMELCKRNLQKVTRYLDSTQKITFLQSAITDKDGTLTLVNRDEKDPWGMMFSVTEKDKIEKQFKGAKGVTEVKTMTVSNFISSNDLQGKEITVLSIDAEGWDFIILNEFLKSGLKPLYIIYENLFSARKNVKELMADNGYVLITEAGWNHIYTLK
ncbi:hypothetical protein ABK040_007108 [Willaertia magna]